MLGAFEVLGDTVDVLGTVPATGCGAGEECSAVTCGGGGGSSWIDDWVAIGETLVVVGCNLLVVVGSSLLAPPDVIVVDGDVDGVLAPSAPAAVVVVDGDVDGALAPSALAAVVVVDGKVEGALAPSASAAVAPATGSPFGAFVNAAGLLSECVAVTFLPGAFAPGAFEPPASAGATPNAEARRALLKSV